MSTNYDKIQTILTFRPGYEFIVIWSNRLLISSLFLYGYCSTTDKLISKRLDRIIGWTVAAAWKAIAPVKLRIEMKMIVQPSLLVIFSSPFSFFLSFTFPLSSFSFSPSISIISPSSQEDLHQSRRRWSFLLMQQHFFHANHRIARPLSLPRSNTLFPASDSGGATRD